MNLQKLIFQEIRNRIPSDTAWSLQVADLLHVGRDAVYRRERGEVQMTVDELEILCRKFSISLDRFVLTQQHAVVFKHTSLNQENLINYTHYIGQLLQHLQMISSCHQKEIIFCADDIPIFHFMAFSELTYFKLYTWNQAVLNLGISYEEFVYELKKQNLEPVFRKLHQAYCAIPSREIWTRVTIQPFLGLLEYFQAIGSFSSERTSKTLIAQLKQLTANLKSWTKAQGKNGEVPFDLYLSPVNLGISQMLCCFDEQQSVSVKLYTINSIATVDHNYVRETVDWIRGILNKSSCLSRLSEKERIYFFNDLDAQVDTLEKKLAGDLG